MSRRLAHVPDGPQRHGQDDAAQMHHGSAAGAAPAASPSTGADLLKCPAEQRARLGIGYVPQGREIFSHLTVEENLRVGLGVRKNGAARDSEPHLRPVSRAEADAEPARRRSFGRPAAAARDRPRAGARAEAADPRRAHRRDSAQIVHEIGDIVLRLNQEEGLTVLLVEQKLPFARRVASEFCILDKGRRVAAGSDRRPDGRSGEGASERLTILHLPSP